jgi:hypothetical protein
VIKFTKGIQTTIKDFIFNIKLNKVSLKNNDVFVIKLGHNITTHDACILVDNVKVVFNKKNLNVPIIVTYNDIDYTNQSLDEIKTYAETILHFVKQQRQANRMAVKKATKNKKTVPIATEI